jgi:hypothetical protein
MTTSVTSDGKITKQVLREGAGALPSAGSTVTLQLVAAHQSDGAALDPARSLVLEPGAADFYSLAASTMRAVDLSRFSASAEYSPSGAASVFDVELLAIADTEANRLCDAGGAAALYRRGRRRGAQAAPQPRGRARAHRRMARVAQVRR